MKLVKNVGADVGNDALKIYLGEANAEAKTKLEVMNVVAPGYKRRILGMEKGQLVNLLDVNVYEEEKDLGRYFVGGIAFKEGRGDLIEKSKRDKKAKSPDTIILLMTGIAYAMYDPNNPKKTENIALGTLLPTEEYWDDELIKEFSQKLKKNYRVKFNSTSFKGADITLNIVDHEIQPESAAGVLANVYDVDGNPRKGMENADKETHLGIFIGSITTEISIFENGEFNPKGFFGIELGTSDPLDRIIEDLGVNMTRHQMDYIIRNNKQLVINEGGETVDKTEDLVASKERRFSFFVKQLVNDINKKLGKQGINTSLINKVDLGGGGSITVIDNLKKEIGLANVNLVEDPRFANALGALYSIIAKQDEQDAAGEVFTSEGVSN